MWLNITVDHIILMEELNAFEDLLYDIPHEFGLS